MIKILFLLLLCSQVSALPGQTQARLQASDLQQLLHYSPREIRQLHPNSVTPELLEYCRVQFQSKIGTESNSLGLAFGSILYNLAIATDRADLAKLWLDKDEFGLLTVPLEEKYRKGLVALEEQNYTKAAELLETVASGLYKPRECQLLLALADSQSGKSERVPFHLLKARTYARQLEK